MALARIASEDRVRYANVDFGSGGGAGFTARVATPLNGGAIELHLDRLDGPLIGKCAVPDSGGWQTWQDASCPATGANETHFRSLKFGGPAGRTGGLFNFDRYQFRQEAAPW